MLHVLMDNKVQFKIILWFLFISVEYKIKYGCIQIFVCYFAFTHVFTQTQISLVI